MFQFLRKFSFDLFRFDFFIFFLNDTKMLVSVRLFEEKNFLTKSFLQNTFNRIGLRKSGFVCGHVRKRILKPLIIENPGKKYRILYITSLLFLVYGFQLIKPTNSFSFQLTNPQRSGN